MPQSLCRERGALDPKGVAQVLREAIDDMRLAIDTLSPGRDGLLEALGNLRYRLEPRFRAAGVELRFTYRDLPDGLDVPQDAALQILRVLQEALTNVLKHARARQATRGGDTACASAFMLAVSDVAAASTLGAGTGARSVGPPPPRRSNRRNVEVASDAAAHASRDLPLPNVPRSCMSQPTY